MSLNDKYIINGSTLSDIGNALREKKIIKNPTQKISKTVYYYYTTASGYQQTFNANSFPSGLEKTPTKALVYIVSNANGNGYVKAQNFSASTNVGSYVILPLPFTFKGYSTTYNVYSIALNVYPLDEDNNIIIPTGSLSAYWRSTTMQVEEETSSSISFGDIATQIQETDNIGAVLLWPFTIPHYSSTSTNYNFISQYISETEDIVELYFQPNSGGIYRVAPALTAGDAQSNTAGSGQELAYPIYTYTTTNTSQGYWGWENRFSKTSMYVYYNKNKKRLQTSANNDLTGVQVPAVLIYKKHTINSEQEEVSTS